ncbi:hypothetical protein O3M35_012844 [Rhynocoris fuscipes]|uniref:Uncharacterized protein n=1 Tax=Rhynocoris fuscipes TaxID=488301 RepID=A0AAW1CFS8_9HEMI
MLMALHLILFDDEGQPKQHRKALRAFTGFQFTKDSSFYQNKLQQYLNIRYTDLLLISDLLNLSCDGSKEDVADNICSFLLELNDADDETHNSNDDTEDDESENSFNNDSKDVESQSGTSNDSNDYEFT